MKSNQEIEIKLRVTDVPTLRRRLKQLKARQITPRTHELNTLYDTPKKKLSRHGQIIRIRVERPSSRMRMIWPWRDSFFFGVSYRVLSSWERV